VEIVAVLVLVAAAVAVYFLVIKKPAVPQLDADDDEPKQLEPKPKPGPAPKAKEPAKEPAKPQAKEPATEKAEKPKASEPKAPAAKPAEPTKAKEPEAPAKQPAPAAKEPAPAAPEKPADKPTEAAPKPAKAAAPTPTRKRDVEGLRKGLVKAREKEGFFGRLKALFLGKKEIDPGLVDRIEEVLVGSDVGMKTTQLLLDDIRGALARNELADNDKVWDALRQRATGLLDAGGGGLPLPAHPTVVMVVGVNGVGKTTTIGKLATKLKADGKKVVLAAGDTFRAAAVQQLEIWGKRVGCEVVSGKDGANPGAVIFDAIQRAKEIDADVVLADTAGRLHTKTNLMEELTKVSRTMGKALQGAPHETLLVLDATNGQNAMSQAAMFKEALPVTGLVLTKLDGTAKGGIVLGVCAEHGIPVRYIGIGERAEDLRDFVADEFVEALLGQGDEAADAAA
jgi:fused signal recognition particle receptor